MKIFLTTALLAFSAHAAHAQLFVTSFSGQKIASYDPVSGATINASLVTGLTNTDALSTFGGALYVANGSPAESIGKYALDGTRIATPFINSYRGKMSISEPDFFVFTFANTLGKYTTAGAVVDVSFITTLNSPESIARLGNTLYIGNGGSSSVGTYRADTGAVIDASFLTGVGEPAALAIFGNTLYVANYTADCIGSYNASTGAVINASLIMGLNDPVDIKVFGGFLYVANRNGGTIGKYAADTGAVINATFISGVSAPNGLAIAFDKSTAIDLGVISDARTTYATPDRTTLVNIPAARAVAWYKFTISASADAATGRFLDIATMPTMPSTLTGDDTEIAIYNADGVRVAINDDEGVHNPARIGSYSQLSFGANTNARGPLTAAGFTNGGLASGQDGTLAAGTYYLAVAPYDIKNSFQSSEFDVANVSANTGALHLEFRTGIPAPPALNLAPTVAVNPKSVKATTKSKIKIIGISADANGDTPQVFVKVGKGKFQPAKVSGFNWSFTAKLKVGKNSVQVYSLDSGGLKSPLRKVKIVRRP